MRTNNSGFALTNISVSATPAGGSVQRHARNTTYPLVSGATGPPAGAGTTLRCIRSSPPPTLTDRFFAAAALANETHGDQRRLGTQVPYAAHLMIVAGLVLEDGGDETQAIAALLHDTVEDGGGRPMLEHIRTTFGDEVASIVEQCSDTLDPDDPRSWRERKVAYLDHLPEVTDPGVLRVALADKVHNARSIVRDYRAEGHALWDRFTNKTIDDQLWYYRALLDFFSTRDPSPLVEDLRRALAELEDLAEHDDRRGSPRPDADRGGTG